MPSTLLASRTRAALSALVVATATTAVLVATAGPAAADTDGPVDAVRAASASEPVIVRSMSAAAAEEPAREPAGPALARFNAIREALEALRDRAVQPAETCVEAGNSNDVPRVVADIFRCRLAEAGYTETDAKRIAVEAVVISHCESKWDPNAVVFDGRYLNRRHANGNFYSAAGVFQFIRKTADEYVDGGYAQVTNPRRNIDAAARLYLANRERGAGGWEDWACAAANDGFKVGSVLPGWPGGPAALPSWAAKYVA